MSFPRFSPPFPTADLTPRGALITVAGLWLVTAGSATWTGVTSLARQHGNATLPVAEGIGTALTVTAMIAAWIWTTALTAKRQCGPASTPALLPLAISSAALVLYLLNFAGLLPGSPEVIVGDVASGVLLVCLALTISARYAQPLRRGKRGQNAGVGLVAGLLAFLAFLVVPVLAQLAATLPGPHLAGSQEDALGLHTHAQLLVHIAWAAVVEELVLTAVPLVLLTAARRPVWQCLVVVMVLRLLPHAYMGVDALPALWAAAACAALYLGSRRVLPLIMAHAVYDLIVPFLPPPFTLPVPYLALGLCVGFAVVVALAFFTERPRHERGAV